MADRKEGHQITIFGDGNIIGDHSSADVRKDGAAPPPLDLDSAEAEAARRLYLKALRKRYNVAHTAGFLEAIVKNKQIGSPKRLALLGESGVYVPLTLDARERRFQQLSPAPEDLDEVEREIHPLSLAKALDLLDNLAIIGRAGSGKTTLLKVIASVLAAEDPHQLAPDLSEAIPTPPPLPIFLPLRLFEYACRPEDANYQRCLSDLLRFVDDWFAQELALDEILGRFLSEHIRQGRAWLLLDALDEVPEPDQRKNIRNVINTLADRFRKTRVLVTARVMAYGAARLSDRFHVLTVRDLNEKQRTQMVQLLYQNLEVPNAGRVADGLIARFASSRELQELTRTPVMVWAAAIVHTSKGRLPESRAALYHAYVDILLRHSLKQYEGDIGAVLELTGGQDFMLSERQEYLTYAAFEVHRRLAPPAGKPERQLVFVGERDLTDDILAPYFEEAFGDKPRIARRKAQQYLNLMVEHSGLIVQTEEGYAFGDHLTMQEFLAAWHLGDNYRYPDYSVQLPEMVENTWWREVLLLTTGYLAETRSPDAYRFLQQLAPQGLEDEYPDKALTALELTGRALIQLQARFSRPSWYGTAAQAFANRLYRLLYAEPVGAPVAVRHEAGLVLGRLYAYPGQGELADPRFAGSRGLPEFVPIEEGWFWMGSTEEQVQRLIEETGEDYWSRETPRHRVYLDSYEIARTPTTNAMFAQFIEDGGYEDQRWWTEAIEDGYWRDGRVQDWPDEDWHNLPRHWNDDRWNNPSQPVVGVNWYEAVAYCRWLTAVLDDGHTYRLPTEAEWERAARGRASPPRAGGTGEGAYPWGDDWRDDHCNSEEAGLGMTSPVGIFPWGTTEGGIEDMVGNVYEWCRDWYGEDYYAHSQDERNPTGPDRGDSRILRGGSWYSAGPSRCRCGSRLRYLPRYRSHGRGFRCVRSLSS
jgi:formylglycine-generating enzyme required for sulfatase activity/energy-coupling factor transporter ATP-binding protein EcfA2